jgi:long-chain acyl-CoA synthetase
MGRTVIGRPILARLGLRDVRLALSGGAMLAPAVAALWSAWGLPMRIVYGSVECAGAAALLRRAGERWVVADRPGGVELSVSADGELLVAGPNVAESYQDGTPITRDDAGRLHTGDMAIDDGEIEIRGPGPRRLHLASGTAVDPAPVEAVLRGNQYVAQAIVFGDGWPVAGALLEPDLDSIAVWAAGQGMSFSTPRVLLDEAAVRDLLADVMDDAARRIARDGGPRLGVHRVLREPLVPGVDVAPSGSVRSTAALRRRAGLIDEMGREIGGRERVREAATAMGGHET